MRAPGRGNGRLMAAALVAFCSLTPVGAHREYLRRRDQPPAGQPTIRTWGIFRRTAHWSNEVEDTMTITFIGVKGHKYLQVIPYYKH
jgi:hypothetical protein